MEIKILTEKMGMEEVKTFAENWYVTMIKGAVDVVQNKVALGGDYHIEAGELLSQHGSKLQDVWGFNIRFDEDSRGVLEFDSMINIKPNLGNKSRSINDEELVKQAEHIIKEWVIFN